MHIDDLLKKMVEREASDLHIKVGSPPLLRIHGELSSMTDLPPLTKEEVKDIIGAMCSDQQKRIFEEKRELDLAYAVEGLGRFRVNVFLQRQNIGAVLRLIPVRISTLDELDMPLILKTLSLKPRGLVLVTGPTGSGKSTTLAAMVDYINENRRCHIMTIEDPIEFVHEDKESVVNQRELKSDTLSFTEALKHVLRQDPDVILIGEMRDLETISIALTAAETGHLVFGTLHTTGSAETINRVIDVFPAGQQDQIRSQLSTVLEGVISQTLCRTLDGRGRVAAIEIMVCTSAIRNLIREDKIYQIESIIQINAAIGMQTLDSSLSKLCRSQRISKEEALGKSSHPEALGKLL